MKAIFAPKYIPADIMRKLTVEQLKIIQTQRNTKGRYSQNADRAQKILWQNFHTNVNAGIMYPLTYGEKTGWSIPEEETVDLTPYLNGTEAIKEE